MLICVKQQFIFFEFNNEGKINNDKRRIKQKKRATVKRMQRT